MTTTVAPRPLRIRPTGPERRCEQHLHRSINGVTPAAWEAIEAVLAGASPWPLVMTGETGRGKTCAALCIADLVASCRYFTVDTLCDETIEVQQGRRDDGYMAVTPTRWWRELRHLELVIVDEIGARSNVSDHHHRTLQRLLDERTGQPLICISNASVSHLRTLYDDRIAGRLIAGTSIKLDGQDRRLTPDTNRNRP